VWWIYSVGLREALEVLVVANLRLAIPTWLAARLLGIPVIFDMVEYFPMMFSVHQKGRKTLKSLFKSPRVVSLVEYASVHLVDYTCVVVEEQKQRLLGLGITEDRVFVVSNTPIIRGEDRARAVIPPASELDDEFRLVYAGLVAKGRGLDLILRALQHIKARDHGRPRVMLYVVGDGEYLPQLKDLARGLDVEDRVEFLGWKPPHEISHFLLQSQVGLVPHEVSGFWNHTIPNKLFDYMLCGLPVLCTPASPVRRLVEAERCGIVVSEQPEDVAGKILELRGDMQSLQEMGRRGRRAVLERHNWEHDGTLFLELLDTAVKRV
jgi:glycosyltransferase involved in cell wall biosynthesis